ncbi:MAG: hypothetical protein E7375_02745 [Clostridiales bacterium]|nr:hypothetical protein [Clostridiales bacterium]
MNIWKDFEVCDLFAEIEECKKRGVSLKSAFLNHAKKYKRKANSVRNYYYLEVENLKKDGERCKKLNIDLSKHTKFHFKKFKKQDVELLMTDIEELTKTGLSVRSACLRLSNGNLTEMTRLQNKYQNLKKQKICEENKIIKFSQKQKLLTENEINSLFLGLVKLIKKTAVEEFLEKNREEKNSSALILKKVFLDLSKKEIQMAQLKEKYELLRIENENLKLSKQEALKEHLKKKNAQRLKNENI